VDRGRIWNIEALRSAKRVVGRSAGKEWNVRVEWDSTKESGWLLRPLCAWTAVGLSKATSSSRACVSGKRSGMWRVSVFGAKGGGRGSREHERGVGSDWGRSRAAKGFAQR